MMSEQQPESTDDDNIEIDETIVDEDGIEIDDDISEDDGQNESIDDEEDTLESEESAVGEVEDEALDTESDNLDIADDPQLEQSGTSDEMEIDAALAAVSQLTLLTQDDPEEDIVDADYQPVSDDSVGDVDVDVDVDLEHEPEYTSYEFEQPQDISMSRGQLASVIPAFTLIILGGWLTFTLTTNTILPSAGLLFSVVLIGVGSIFLSQWLTSGRWSRGNFFLGASTILIGAIQLYFLQVSPNTVQNGWSLWIVALGLVLFGAGYMTRPRLPRLSIMGFLTIIAGVIAYVITADILDSTIIKFISNLWFVGVAIVIFMMIAPLIRRRQ